MKPTIECIARALIIQNNHILFCQNIRHGYHFLPGGHIEFGEPAAIALARELREELGVEATVGPLALVTEEAFSARRQHHEVNFVFHVALSPKSETLPSLAALESEIAFTWVDRSTLDEHDIRPSTIRNWLSQPSADGIAWRSGILA